MSHVKKFMECPESQRQGRRPAPAAQNLRHNLVVPVVIRQILRLLVGIRHGGPQPGTRRHVRQYTPVCPL